MKKVTRIFGLVCLAGLLACVSSCKKNQDTKEGSIVEISVPDGLIVEDGERAYVDYQGKVYWNADDQLVVYNLSDQYDESKRSVFNNVTGAGPKARFQGPSVGPKKTFGYRYFYPTEVIDWSINDGDGDLANFNREHFVVSHTQNYCNYSDNGHVASIMDPDAMPMAVKPASLTGYAQLKHIFGVADVNFRADTVGKIVEVEKVELIDQGFNLWGTCSLCLHNVDITEGTHVGSLETLWAHYKNHRDDQFAQMMADYVTASPADGGLGWESQPEGNSIIMNCVHKNAAGEDVYVTLENTENMGYTHFMFLVRPLACSQGMIVKVTLKDGTEYTMTDYSAEVLGQDPMADLRDYTIRPGYIKSFGFGVPHNGTLN